MLVGLGWVWFGLGLVWFGLVGWFGWLVGGLGGWVGWWVGPRLATRKEEALPFSFQNMAVGRTNGTTLG